MPDDIGLIDLLPNTFLLGVPPATRGKADKADRVGLDLPIAQSPRASNFLFPGACCFRRSFIFAITVVKFLLVPPAPRYSSMMSFHATRTAKAFPLPKHQAETEFPYLGSPRWKDPERRQSIKLDSRVKMEWKISTSLWVMSCWVATAPAQRCLTAAIIQIEALVESRKNDVWDRERTTLGCSWDRSMHGRSLDDAQPTIIFSSASKICLRNAKRIVRDEKIKVDPRGIGIQYYENGPMFLARASDLESGLQHMDNNIRIRPREKEAIAKEQVSRDNSASHQESIHSRTIASINGALVVAGLASCTIGGVLAVADKLLLLTVAHAFEQQSPPPEGSEGTRLQ